MIQEKTQYTESVVDRDSWGGELAAHFRDGGGDASQCGLVAGMRDCLVHEFPDLAHLGVAQSARRKS